MALLKELKKYANDEKELTNFMKIKKANKDKLWHYVKDVLKVELNIDSLFDVHIKRIHEYKR